MEKKLIIVSGVYGSGKTTLVNKILESYDSSNMPFVFNPEQKFADYCKETKTPRTKVVRDKLPDIILEEKAKMEEAISEGRDIIIDSLCISVKGRIIYREKQTLKDYSKECWYILLPTDESDVNELLTRLKARDPSKGSATADGLKEFRKIAEIPNEDEGFVQVKYFDIYGNEVEYAPSYDYNLA